MEEDAGKSIHNQDPYDSLIDLNRAGVPLLEIVSEPEIKSSQEAYNFLTEVRKLVRYLEICDGNMEEGSLRCDANVSVNLKEASEFGRKVEVKNMNSIRNVQRAIEFEIKRQIDAIEKGEEIPQETRGFDAVAGITKSQRTKEAANDYRYFPEPDLLPVIVSQDYIEEVKATMPPLPNDLFRKYTREFGLSEYDAQILTDSKEIALYFEEVVNHTKAYKQAANWMMGAIKSYLNENALHIHQFPLKPEAVAALIDLVQDNKVSSSMANQKLFPALIEQPDASPLKLAEELNIIQDSSTDSIEPIIDEVLAQFPDKVEAYRSGKKGLLGMFMGEVMKRSKGKADPKTTNQLLQKKLDA